MKNKIIFALLVIIFTIPLEAQEIGLQLYSLRNEFKKDVPGTLARIKEWGITKIEDGNDGTHGYTMEEYQALLADNNLEMVSVSASYEELRDTPETVLQRAQVYGSKYAVCFWIPHQGTDFTEENALNAIEVFNKAGKLLKDAGITLAYHPHGYEFRAHNEETLMDMIIKKSDYFDFEMDLYWFALPGEDPIAWLQKYPEEFKLMHLKDCEKGIGVSHTGGSDVETNVVLGEGQIDIAGAVAEAKKLGMEYLFIEDESSKVIEQVPLSLKYIKSLK